MKRGALTLSLIVLSFVAGLAVTRRARSEPPSPAEPAHAAIVPIAAPLPTTPLPDLTDVAARVVPGVVNVDRKSTRLNSSHRL